MIDLEKVIKALECCKDINKLNCDDCAYTYNARSDRCECSAEMAFDALELLKSRQPHLLTVEEINALPEGSVCWEEFRDEDGVINNDLTPAMKWGLLSLVNGEADVTCLNAYGTQGYGSSQARSRWWSAKPTDEQRKAVAWE